MTKTIRERIEELEAEQDRLHKISLDADRRRDELAEQQYALEVLEAGHTVESLQKDIEAHEAVAAVLEEKSKTLSAVRGLIQLRIFQRESLLNMKEEP